jgi:hypothetical protein
MGWPAPATRWPPLPHWCAARDWNEASCPGYGTSDIEPVINSMDWFKGKSTGNHRFSH